jgi:hypothetical protein
MTTFGSAHTIVKRTNIRVCHRLWLRVDQVFADWPTG